MIGVAATFESAKLANSILEVLNRREVSPERVSVTTSEDGEVGIIVQADEADYEEMAELMEEQGASTVEVDMTGRRLKSPGRPTLTHSAPPPHRGAG